MKQCASLGRADLDLQRKLFEEESETNEELFYLQWIQSHATHVSNMYINELSNLKEYIRDEIDLETKRLETKTMCNAIWLMVSINFVLDGVYHDYRSKHFVAIRCFIIFLSLAVLFLTCSLWMSLILYRRISKFKIKIAYINEYNDF